MNNDVKFLNIEWRTGYATHFENHLDCMPQLFFRPDMCGFWYVCMLDSSQTPVVNWQTYLFILYYSTKVNLYSPQPDAIETNKYTHNSCNEHLFLTSQQDLLEYQEIWLKVQSCNFVGIKAMIFPQ